MGKTDKIFWIGFLLLAPLILKGYPGFYLIMAVFCTVFSILYLVAGFWLFKGIGTEEQSKSKKTAQIAWRVIYGWGCSVAILTLLFKINNYPGFDVMSKIGASVTGIILLITIFQFHRTSSLFYKRAIPRLLPVFIFSFICLFPMSALDSSRTIVDADRIYPSEWKYNDWTPFIMRDSDTTNYYNLHGVGVDTLYSGDIFKAKLFMPIREFYDSLGNNLILDEHEMHFSIGLDTFPKYSVPDLTRIDKYLTVVKDTGYLEIPIDSLISRYSWDSVLWRASITPTADTTYAIEGNWIIMTEENK